jgi:C-terminal peptidase prc
MWLLGVLGAVMLLVGCGDEPVRPEQDAAAQQEFTFSWQFLSAFFIYQERLPADPAVYATPAELYTSVHDSFTIYFEPLQAQRLLQALTTETAGLGIMLDSVASGYLVERVHNGSPAQRADLRDGDTILSVDGHSLAGVGFDQAQGWFTFSVGDTVVLSVKRGDAALTVTAIADKYLAPSVVSDSLDSTTAYILLTMFSETTPNALGSAGEMRQALAATAWAQTTVLDLRGNMGGSLDQCHSIASEFLAENTPIIRMHLRQLDTADYTIVEKDSVMCALPGGSALGRRFFVLVDHYTASASEILVSCLKEQRAADATVIGTRTYGKGSGWTYSLTPLRGLVTVTCLLIDPLSAPSYNHVGIDPNVTVPDEADALTLALAQIHGTGVGKRPAAVAVHRIDRLADQARPKMWLPALTVRP